MTTRARVGVLASGGGSNLQATIDHLDALGTARGADVVIVLANRAEAGALVRAERHDIARDVIPDPSDGAAMLGALRSHGVDLLVLAGYLRHIPSDVTAAFHGRLINVHPALLPSFGGAGMYGARVHRAVIASGARVSGATVHFVDEHYDRGPIIAQWPVPVFATDSAESLAARVLRVEHLLLPRVVDAVGSGRLTLGDDGIVHGVFDGESPDAMFTLPTDTRSLADDVTRALAR